MKKYRLRRFMAVLMIILLLPLTAAASEDAGTEGAQDTVGIEAPHALLMEASTGTILYEKDADTPVHPASVTKIMTMLLIFEALDAGKIKLEDNVTVSERAASMGGSQVFLEPNEQQTVDTMLKCIAIASANDACVAMAEFVAGSEEAFVGKMNEKAKSLGMEHAHFVNCNGLDTDGHLLSAKDVALMSQELLIKHPQVHDYCTVWMENFTHKTAKGTSEFGLNNTNKLIRQYEYCTGLKTGSTGKAGFCVSASAKKDDMELIAVIMNGETSKSRFQDAKTLFGYGYANYQIYRDTDKEREALKPLPVTGGVETFLLPVYGGDFRYLLLNGEKMAEIERRQKLPETLRAPIEKGETLGTLEYYCGDKKLGEIPIIAGEEVPAAKYMDYLKRVWLTWMI